LLDAPTIYFPSGLHDRETIDIKCPSKVLRQVPVFASHIFMVLSHEPLIMRLLS
jgi:hypothetical protein